VSQNPDRLPPDATAHGLPLWVVRPGGGSVQLERGSQTPTKKIWLRFCEKCRGLQYTFGAKYWRCSKCKGVYPSIALPGKASPPQLILYLPEKKVLDKPEEV